MYGSPLLERCHSDSANHKRPKQEDWGVMWEERGRDEEVSKVHHILAPLQTADMPQLVWKNHTMWKITWKTKWKSHGTMWKGF